MPHNHDTLHRMIPQNVYCGENSDDNCHQNEQLTDSSCFVFSSTIIFEFLEIFRTLIPSLTVHQFGLSVTVPSTDYGSVVWIDRVISYHFEFKTVCMNAALCFQATPQDTKCKLWTDDNDYGTSFHAPKRKVQVNYWAESFHLFASTIIPFHFCSQRLFPLKTGEDQIFARKIWLSLHITISIHFRISSEWLEEEV